jgi:hypothetical protein
VVGKINKTDQAESLVDVLPSSGFKFGRSFVEVLRSTSGGEEKASVLKVVSLALWIFFRCILVLSWGLLVRCDLLWIAMNWRVCLSLWRQRLFL